MDTTVQTVRGCGTRDIAGTYLCCGLSPFGVPIEERILDPVIKWPGKWQRGFKIISGSNGINHVIIFISKKDYVSPWSFVEEATLFGISRKVPPTFPFEKLTPGKSFMWFCHAYAGINTVMEIKREKPLKNCHKPDQTIDMGGWHTETEACTFAHKDLSYWLHPKATVVSQDGDLEKFEIEMPAFKFTGIVPVVEESFLAHLYPGLFLKVPITHVEMPFEKNEKSAVRANKSGYEVVITEW